MLRLFLSILLVTLVIIAFNQKTTFEKLITKKATEKTKPLGRGNNQAKNQASNQARPETSTEISKNTKARVMLDIQNRMKEVLVRLKPLAGVNKSSYEELSTSLKNTVSQLHNAWDMHPGNYNCMHKIDLILDKVKDVYNTFKSMEIPLTDENPELKVWQSAIKHVEELLADIAGFSEALCSIKRIGSVLSADVKPSETNGPLPGYERLSYAESQYQ